MTLPPDTLSSAELLSYEGRDHDWLVDGRLVRVGASLMVGDRETGKSTLARDLALCVTRGNRWLGFATQPGPVLYVPLDGDLATLRGGFVAAGLRRDDDVRVMQPTGSEDPLLQIEKRAKSIEPALVVIDGVRPLLHAARTNPRSESDLFDAVAGLALRCHTHVLLVHDLEQRLSVELSLMLGRDLGGLDAVLMVSTAGDYRLLRTLQKRGRNLLDPIAIGTVTPSSAAERHELDESIAGEILSHLRRTRCLASARELLPHVSDARPIAVARALHLLRQRGRLIRVGSGTPQNPHRYTGFDVPKGAPGDPWLRRVKPWAPLGELQKVIGSA